MKMQIAKGLLYVGVIGLAMICIIAMIDNYNLAIDQGLTSTISCYNTESFDTNLDETKIIRQCDQYNPQVVFFGSIILLCIDAFMFYFFNNLINANSRMVSGFEKELKGLSEQLDSKKSEEVRDKNEYKNKKYLISYY